MAGNICVTCAMEIASKLIVQFVNCVSCSLPIHIGCISGNKLGIGNHVLISKYMEN
jgi:hypothetical protein